MGSGFNDDDAVMRTPEGYFGDDWEYEFQVSRLVIRDEYLLSVLRWKMEPNGDYQHQYLTTEGWRIFTGEGEVSDLIRMSGRSLYHLQEVKKLILETMLTAIATEEVD